MGLEYNKQPCVQAVKGVDYRNPWSTSLDTGLLVSFWEYKLQASSMSILKFFIINWLTGNIWSGCNECINNIIHQYGNFSMVKSQIYLWFIQVKYISNVIQLVISFLVFSSRIFLSMDQALLRRRWEKFQWATLRVYFPCKLWRKWFCPYVPVTSGAIEYSRKCHEGSNSDTFSF